MIQKAILIFCLFIMTACGYTTSGGYEIAPDLENLHRESDTNSVVFSKKYSEGSSLSFSAFVFEVKGGGYWYGKNEGFKVRFTSIKDNKLITRGSGLSEKIIRKPYNLTGVFHKSQSNSVEELKKGAKVAVKCSVSYYLSQKSKKTPIRKPKANGIRTLKAVDCELL